MKTVTLTNQKGGVGKTTTAHILSSGLVKAGFRVLVVDIDPQTNLTYTAGIEPEETQFDLYDLFKGEAAAAEAILQTAVGFDMIAGSLNLAGADMEFTKAGREYILKELLEPVAGNYDFCIIDTPPALGILAVNALTASDEVIVPMGADVYSMQGLSQLHGLFENVKKYCNPALTINGLLLTKYNPRTNINKQLKESLHDVAGLLQTKVYSTQIREATAIKEVQFLQSDIFKEYPTANVTADYQQFIDEFLKGMKA